MISKLMYMVPYNILSYLFEKEHVNSIYEVNKKVNVSYSYLFKVINKFSDLGLVNLDKYMGDKKNKTEISITQKGKDIYKQLNFIVTNVTNK